MLESLNRQNIILLMKGGKEKVPTMRSTNEKMEQTMLNRRNKKDTPKKKVWGNQLKELQEKGRQQLNKKEEKSLGNLNLKVPSILPITKA